MNSAEAIAVLREALEYYVGCGAEDIGLVARTTLAATEHVEDGWLPIETAPKDGSVIMVGNHERGVWIAEYRPVYQSGYRPNNPWSSMMLNHAYNKDERASMYPTHWRPLPPAPSVQAQGKEGER